MLLIAAGLVAIFTLAARINPYNPDGSARKMSTHTQLGLQRCTLEEKLGVPCPSCGMTTSFSLLLHGDLLNSLRANWVGTLLATFCLALIPWSVVSAARNRALFVTSLEKAVIAVIVVLLCLMLFRWAIVLGFGWFYGWPSPN